MTDGIGSASPSKVSALDQLPAIPTTCRSLLGSTVKGTLGVGMGMVASLLPALSDRAFITSAIVTAAERGTRTDAGLASRPLVGSLPDVSIGNVAVALTGQPCLAVLVRASELAAAVAPVRSVSISTTPCARATAGLLCGFTGSTTGGRCETGALHATTTADGVPVPTR
jgi:hypothetical protein